MDRGQKGRGGRLSVRMGSSGMWLVAISTRGGLARGWRVEARELGGWSGECVDGSAWRRGGRDEWLGSRDEWLGSVSRSGS